MITNPSGVDAVLADFDRGDPPIRLRDLPSHPLVPRKDGRKPHLSACHRWVTRGIRRHRLEAVRCGGTLCTSRSALTRFYRRTSGIDPSSTAPQPGGPRDEALSKAEQELEAAGL